MKKCFMKDNSIHALCLNIVILKSICKFLLLLHINFPVRNSLFFNISRCIII